MAQVINGNLAVSRAQQAEWQVQEALLSSKLKTRKRGERHLRHALLINQRKGFSQHLSKVLVRGSSAKLSKSVGSV
jgi:hypothetical protein